MSKLWQAVLIKKQRSYLYTVRKTRATDLDPFKMEILQTTERLGGNPNAVGVWECFRDEELEQYQETEFPAEGAYLVFRNFGFCDHGGRLLPMDFDCLTEALERMQIAYATFAGVQVERVMFIQAPGGLPEIEVR